jgi:hypothetical protein
MNDRDRSAGTRACCISLGTVSSMNAGRASIFACGIPCAPARALTPQQHTSSMLMAAVF